MLKYNSFSEAYIGLAKILRDEHEWLVSPRGQKIKESLGVQFRISDPRHRLPYIKARKFSMSYLIAETIWYMSANDSTEWISRYAPFWKNITDDGRTANSAYGARIFKPHDRASKNVVQWEYVREELRRDPDSRRAVIHIRSAHDSIHDSKDVPCTLSLQFFIRGGNLHLHVSMRSSDIILGLAYDVPAFTIMQETMANELGVGLGEYVHTSNSLHCYERDFEMLDEIANSELSKYIVPMRKMSGTFPINTMVEMERTVSSITDPEILSGYGVFVPPHANEMTESDRDLIQDWSRVLLSRRLRKLKKEGGALAVLEQVSDPCYKFFER